MEWDAPAIILSAAPYGEGDLLVTVMTQAQGLHRGLARGGASRRQVALWQPGNLAQLRWVARLPEQLGSLTGELVHPGAALAMEDRLALAILSAACAVAEGALPDREPLPLLFGGLLGLVAGLSDTPRSLTALVRWEVQLLAGLGYGLDLSRCAVSGTADGLAWVSPRTGRAVADAAAGEWRPRLLPLPPFLRAGFPSDPPEAGPGGEDAPAAHLPRADAPGDADPRDTIQTADRPDATDQDAMDPDTADTDGPNAVDQGADSPGAHGPETVNPKAVNQGAVSPGVTGLYVVGPADWRDGLRLTGHFLARDAFGHAHRPLPLARERLADLVAAMCPAPPPPPPDGR